jgi:hypothetical protein
MTITRTRPSIGTEPGKSGRRHFWNRRDFVQNIVLHPRNTFRFAIEDRGKPDPRRLDLLRIREAVMDVAQA